MAVFGARSRAERINQTGAGGRRLLSIALVLAVLAPVAVFSPQSADAAESDPLSLEGFSDEAVLTTGLNQPISLDFLPDGRMLVLEKGGQIKIGNPATVPMVTEVYLTLQDITINAERGLIDIAISPDFASTGEFFLYYTPTSTQRARIARFDHVENTGGTTSRGDLSSEFVVWEDTTGYTSCCHYGGGLDFGPDGNLWLTVGDKFVGDRAADLQDASGSVIRVEPDGDVPPDNPFADGAGGVHPYIWAYGLRNPFRASWDLETNRFFIGEVGGNDIPESWEDLHIAKYDPAYSGLDYGWPGCEGPYPYTDFPECGIEDGDLAEPIFAYPHSGQARNNASITGGFVYRGNQFPAEWDGVYFYGDYARNFIRYLRFDETGETVTGDFPFKSSEQLPGGTHTIVSLAEGADGALYYAMIASGQIRRIVYEGGNQAPTITSAQPDATTGPTPLTVNFAASATDPEGDPISYTWHFGDGTTATGATAQHTYTTEGQYEAYVSVSDGSHTVVSDSELIQAGVVPEVEITSPVDGALFRAGDTIQVEGVATDDGPLDPEDYSWTLQFGHDNHFHPADVIPNGPTGSFEIGTSGHDYSNDTWYELTLEVADSSGLVGTDTVQVRPDKVELTVATQPAGLITHLDSIPHEAPWVHDTLIGFEHTISARSPQCLDGDSYVFDSWSDGGDQTHTYTVGDADATVTAVFVQNGVCAAPVPDGLVMRLQGDQGVSTSGSAVTGWNDLSPSGNGLGVITGSPTVVPSALSGHDVVSFDGVDDVLGRSFFSGLPTGDDDRSVFAVVKYDGGSAFGGWAGFTYGSPYTNQAWGPVRTASGTLGIQGWGSGNDADSGAPADGGGWLVQSIVKSGSGYVHYKDGVPIGSGSHVYNTAQGIIRLGGELNGNRRIDMDVAEILVYDRALVDAERDQVEAYLRQQYFEGATVPPSVTLTSPTSGETVRDSNVDVTWTTSGDLAPGDHVHLTLDGGSHVTVAAGAQTHTFTDVADGGHVVEATIASSAHEVYAHPEATDSVSFTVDTQPVSSDLPLDGLVMHVESDLNVIMDGSNSVGGWLDQSGRGNDFADAFGAPAFAAATTPSGLPAVSFDGADDALERGGGLNGMPLGNSDRTVLTVVDYHSNGWGGFSWGVNACGKTYGNVVSKDGDLAVQGWCADADSNIDANGAGWLVQGSVYDGGQLTQYRNGSTIASKAAAFNTAADRITLGREIDGAPYVDIDVAAILVYDRALSSAEFDQASAYLDSKYLSGTVEDVPPSAPGGLSAVGGDGQVALSWTASTDLNGDLAGYQVFRSTSAGAIDPSSDTPLATATGTSFTDGTVTNGTEYFYLVTAIDDAGLQSAASNEVAATPAVPVPDTTPPAAPTGLSATAGDSTVTLTWDAQSEPDLAGYQVFRATTAGAIDTEADAPVATVTQTEYVDDTVTNGTGYFYAVTAIDESDNASAASTEASATPQAAPSDCSAPFGGDTTLCLEADTGVVGGGTVTGWNDMSPEGNDLTATGDPTLTTTPSGAPAIAFDGDGDALERLGNLAMPQEDGARTVVTVVNYDSNGWGGFSWGKNGCDDTFGVGVAKDGDLGLQGWCTDFDSDVDGTGTGWMTQTITYGDDTFVHYRDGVEIDTGTRHLTTGTARIRLGAEIDGAPFLDMDTAAVLVYDRVLTDEQLDQVEAYLDVKYVTGVVEDVAPAVPGALDAAAGDGQIELSWTASTDPHGDLAGYQVFRSTTAGAIDTAADTPLATVTGTSFVDDTVTNGTEYFYAVTAFDDAGLQSNPSNEASATPDVIVPDTTPPAAPTGLAATAGDSTITLAWDAQSEPDLAGYQVFRATTAGAIDTEADAPVATGTEATFVDDALTNGTEYFYAVTAIDDSDNASTASTEASATPQAAPSDCSAPFGAATTLCLEADTGVAGSGTVAGWTDMSDAGNDLTATGDPTLTTTPSGAPAIAFDGDGDALERLGNLAMPTGNADRTVVTVVNYDSNGWGGFSWGKNGCDDTFGVGVAKDGDLGLQGWCTDFDSGVDGTGTGWMIQSITYGDDTFVHYRDGVEIDTGTRAFTTGTTRIRLGAEIDGSPFLDMDTAAVLVYDRELSASEHQAVLSYLQAKYF
ncbi:PQQ-dependent sugar dehydrogenase [Demequina activiva]|uniref:Glucose/arabinose dehydrogenase, beta-propeller fold n=1 Tax=Demequina activiva TaxID=1582364 RepID=A0A919Q2L8_9MICO|nr:PQQ-dependent sugar dehydrogenase [Demequina activiva]GIG55125.1 hypothetical protein Dac01nite_18770 [Demequina activiva]